MSERKHHKYYMRVETGPNKYRYFYSQREYNAYMSGNRRNTNSSNSGFLDGITNIGRQFLSNLSNASSKTSKTDNKTVGSKFARSIINRVGGTVVSSISNTVNEGKTIFSRLFTKTSKTQVSKTDNKPHYKTPVSKTDRKLHYGTPASKTNNKF